MDMKIHPYIKMSLFLVFALSLSLGGYRQLLLGMVILAGGFLVVSRPELHGLWKMLCRLRWLWLSLMVFYFWFTPGMPVFEEFQQWSPTVEGVYQGGLRIGILALMAMAAHLLFQACNREQLIASIRWMVTPLELLGISRDRFAVRLLLVFEAVPGVQTSYRNSDESSAGNFIQRTGIVVAGLFENVIQRAESSTLHQVSFEHPGIPKSWQWLYPLFLALAFGIMG